MENGPEHRSQCSYFLNLCLRFTNNSEAAGEISGTFLISSRCSDNITTGITDDSVTYSSLLIRDV